jgi:hypothetical protein
MDAGAPEKRENLKMRETKRRFCNGLRTAGVVVAALCIVSMPAVAQVNAPRGAQSGGKPVVPIVGGFDKVKVLPPGGPAPRTADGHPDLTGRWYPNPSGRMLQFAYPLEEATIRQFDSKVTPEEKISFKPGLAAKYTRPAPYGECDQAGTPSTALEQISQHAPMELISLPGGKLWQMFEYPMDVRLIHTDGRPHLKDPDPTFNGDSTAHWEGDTLVVDVIGIDERMRVITGSGGWWPSDKMHVIERITRTSKNLLTYQITIEDPVVLATPWKSAPRVWSLAQDPNDYWTEVFCTLNEEPAEIRRQNAAKTKGK